MKNVHFFMIVCFVSGLNLASYSQIKDGRLVIQTGHNELNVSGASGKVFSHDSKYILTCDQSGVYILWELSSGREIQRFLTKTRPLNTFAEFIAKPSISADNKYVLLQEGYSFSLWDTRTGKELTWYSPKVNELSCPQAYFNPGGEKIIALFNIANSSSQKLVIYDILSKTNEEIVFDRTDRKDITNKFLDELKQAFWSPSFCAISKDAKKFAIGMIDGRVMLFDVSELKRKSAGKRISMNDMKNFFPDTTPVKEMAFIEDDKKLVAHTENGFFIYDVNRETLIKNVAIPTHKSLKPKDGDISKGLIYVDTKKDGSVMSGNGKIAAFFEQDTGSFSARWTFLNMPAADTIRTVYCNESFYGVVPAIGKRYYFTRLSGISNDGKYTFQEKYTDESTQIPISDLKGTVRQILACENIVLNQVGFISNGFFVGMKYHDAFIFNGLTGRTKRLRNWLLPIDTFANGASNYRAYYHTWDSYAMAISDNDSFAVSIDPVFTSFERNICVWDWVHAKLLKKMPVSSYDMYSVSQISNDGKLAITNMGILDLNKGKLICEACMGIGFSKDSKRVYAFNVKMGDHLHTLNVITLASGNVERTIELTTEGWVAAWCISPEGEKLVVVTSRGDIVAWDLQSSENTNLGNFVGALGEREINVVKFSGDGKKLAIALSDRYMDAAEIVLINYPTKTMQWKSDAHSSAIYSLGFSEDASKIISSGNDRTCKIWDVASGTELALFAAYSINDYLIRTPEGYYMASKNGAKALHFVKDNKAYLFSQFDLQYNRPDKVLEKLGLTSPAVIGLYKRLYEKRVKIMGFSDTNFEKDADEDAPIASIVRDNDDEVTFSRSFPFAVKAADNKFNLRLIKINVNGVPVFGSNGYRINDIQSRSIIKRFEIKLSRGKNVIALSVVNERGVESLTDEFVITYEEKGY